MCTCTRTHRLRCTNESAGLRDQLDRDALDPKTSWGLFPVGMREQRCNTWAQCQHSLPPPQLSSHCISSPLLQHYCPSPLPHFLPSLPFSIFVSSLCLCSVTHKQECHAVTCHKYRQAHKTFFLLQPDHCTDTESAVGIIRRAPL